MQLAQAKTTIIRDAMRNLCPTIGTAGMWSILQSSFHEDANKHIYRSKMDFLLALISPALRA